MVSFFEEHPPTVETDRQTELLRLAYKKLEATLNGLPPGRSKSECMTNLNASYLWAVRAIVEVGGGARLALSGEIAIPKTETVEEVRSALPFDLHSSPLQGE